MQTTNEGAAASKDYTEYWEAQVLLVRILQNSGLRVGVKDRLPIFRLWNIVAKRMTGVRQHNVLLLLQALVQMRGRGIEPPHNGKTYV
jgi:hypothetical protein